MASTPTKGQEFYFMSTQTFVLANDCEARDLAEFADALSYIKVYLLAFFSLEHMTTSSTCDSLRSALRS